MRMIYKGTQAREIHVSLQMTLSIFVSILYPFVGNDLFTLMSASLDVNSSTEENSTQLLATSLSIRTKPYGIMLQAILCKIPTSVAHLEAKKNFPPIIHHYKQAEENLTSSRTYL